MQNTFQHIPFQTIVTLTLNREGDEQLLVNVKKLSPLFVTDRNNVPPLRNVTHPPPDLILAVSDCPLRHASTSDRLSFGLRSPVNEVETAPRANLSRVVAGYDRITGGGASIGFGCSVVGSDSRGVELTLADGCGVMKGVDVTDGDGVSFTFVTATVFPLPELRIKPNITKPRTTSSPNSSPATGNSHI
jgi:hypothetical protein